MEVKAYQEDKSNFHEHGQALKDTLTGKNGIHRGALKHPLRRQVVNGTPSTKPNKIARLIDIRKLEHESNRWLYLGTLIGVLLHVVLALNLTFEKREAVIHKQIPIRLFVREPRTFNPYENWKRDIQKKQHSRYIPDQKAPVIDLPELRQSITEPLSAGIDEQELASEAVRQDIPKSAKELFAPQSFELPEYFKSLTTERKLSKLDIWDENITLGMVDSLGLADGLIIIDPNNAKNIKGFAKMPIYISEFRPGPYKARYSDSGSFDLWTVVPGVARMFEFYTGVELAVEAPISLDTLVQSDYPLVYITTARDDVTILSEGKLKAFGDYLRGGGFAIMENGMPWLEYSPDKASFLNILVDSLGEECEFRPIPWEHLVYHCFYDIKPPLPEGHEKFIAPPGRWKTKHQAVSVRTFELEKIKETMISIQANLYEEPWMTDWKGLLHDPDLEKLRKEISKRPDALWGVWLKDRLVAVYSDKGYGHTWKYGTIKARSRTQVAHDDGLLYLNEKMELGLNLFVYGLLRKESSTKKFVDMAPSPGKTTRLSTEEKFKTFLTH